MNYGELRKKILDSISIVLVDELEHLKELEEKGEITSEQLSGQRSVSVA